MVNKNKYSISKTFNKSETLDLKYNKALMKTKRKNEPTNQKYIFNVSGANLWFFLTADVLNILGLFYDAERDCYALKFLYLGILIFYQNINHYSRIKNK